MILDLILIIVLLLICLIGYKVGFLTTLIKIASAISGLIFAFLLTKPVANIVKQANWDSKIENNIYNNVITSEAYSKFSEAGGGEEGFKVLIEELGIPHFLSEMISHKLVDKVDPVAVVSTIVDRVSYVVVCIITFICLLIFSSLFFFILKKIVQGTRHSIGFFRVVDGLLGIGFYALMYLFFLYIGFWIVSALLPVVSPTGEFALFMTEQLHLNNEKFGLAKYLYQNNIIKNFFELIF